MDVYSNAHNNNENEVKYLKRQKRWSWECLQREKGRENVVITI